MKLGTQTGSVINHLYSRGVIGQPTPEVGMGATANAAGVWPFDQNVVQEYRRFTRLGSEMFAPANEEEVQ